jgi:ABC-2 type transport system ATP-binding protein
MTTYAAEHDIVVEGLTKRFGSLEAVKDISFSVRRGEVFGILGPNGAGKTTALECIEGLQPPTAGKTYVLGIDTAAEPGKAKERIGVQLQASAYFDYLKLREILELFGRLYAKRLSPAELLEKVGLVEKIDTPVVKLSGGQQHRFAIAAALVNDPSVIFLDEPTTGLDPQARRNLWEFIQRIHAEGRTVVLTTHYMEEAQFLCQRIAIMDRGRIVALDTPENLIRTLPVPYKVRIRLTAAPSAEGFKGLEAVTSVQGEADGSLILGSSDAARTLPALMAWSSATGRRIDHMEVVRGNLEDVFLTITGRGLRD